jgi:hypothetical protein
MDRQQEEDVLRITAQYIAEVQAGQQPRLSDYLVRYPHYADAITDFVTYYHAVEEDLPAGEPLVSPLPQLSETSRKVLARAWENVKAVPTNGSMTLLTIANEQGLSMSQLADKIGLSSDIVEKLAGTRLLIDPATIPQEVLGRLKHVLHTPLSAIRTSMRRANQGADRLQLAETHTSYHTEQQPASHVQSFREVIEQSLQLSAEQKAAWRDILAREGL